MNGRSSSMLACGVAALWACGGARGGAGTATTDRPAPIRMGMGNVITAEELSRISATSLEEAVRTLRPNWLRNSPTTIRPEGEGTVIVYQDRVRLGGPESLRQINPTQVKEVRYYGPSEAEARFGPGHLHGAIEITSQRGR
jgi:hypothetical protein